MDLVAVDFDSGVLIGPEWRLRAIWVKGANDRWQALIGIQSGVNLYVRTSDRPACLWVETWAGEPRASDGIALVGKDQAPLAIRRLRLDEFGDLEWRDSQFCKCIHGPDLFALVQLIRPLPGREADRPMEVVVGDGLGAIPPVPAVEVPHDTSQWFAFAPLTGHRFRAAVDTECRQVAGNRLARRCSSYNQGGSWLSLWRREMETDWRRVLQESFTPMLSIRVLLAAAILAILLTAALPGCSSVQQSPTPQIRPQLAQVPLPRLPVKRYITRGTYPTVARKGKPLTRVNLALRNAVLAYERAFEPEARGRSSDCTLAVGKRTICFLLAP